MKNKTHRDHQVIRKEGQDVQQNHLSAQKKENNTHSSAHKKESAKDPASGVNNKRLMTRHLGRFNEL